MDAPALAFRGNPAPPSTTAADPRPLVVVAGATGHIGGEVVKELLRSGKFRVRAVVRPRKASTSSSAVDASTSSAAAASSRLARLGAQVWHGDVTDPATIEGCCDGASAAVCALGVRSFDRSDGSVYSVDRDGALAFFEQARASAASSRGDGGDGCGGLRAFVTVATFEGRASRGEESISEAKEEAVDAMSSAARDDASKGTIMKIRVLRPTAYFRDMSSWLLEPLLAGKKGDVVLTGDGGTRINPVDGRDVARLARAEIEACLSSDSAEGDDDLVREIPVGGPQVFTLRSMAALAAEVAASKLRGGGGATSTASPSPSPLPRHHEPPAPIVIRSRPLWPLRLLAPVAGMLAPCWGKAAALRDGARFVLYSSTHDAVAEMTASHSALCSSTLRRFFEERADAVLSAADKAGSARRRRRPRAATGSTSAEAEAGASFEAEASAAAAAPTATSKATTEGAAAPLPVSAAASGP